MDEMMRIGRAIILAMASGFAKPIRFGTNSPNTSEKKVNKPTTTVTLSVCAYGFIASNLLK